jgi:hypothetical protein
LRYGVKKLGKASGDGQFCSDIWCHRAHRGPVADRPALELLTDQTAETKPVSFLEQLIAATDDGRYEILAALLRNDTEKFNDAAALSGTWTFERCLPIPAIERP